MTAPHRPHHHAIAKGVDLNRMTAEIFGKETGLGKGNQVKKGEVLAEVQTEKAVFEVEAPASGRLDKILVKRGEVASLGDVIALIRPETLSSFSVQTSPRVRRLAKELGIDLAAVAGTGPGGRVTEEDVRKAVAQGMAVAQGSNDSLTTVEVTPMRWTIAKRMMHSLQQTAQLTETAWADVTNLAKRRNQLAPGISWNSWILRAVVIALQRHP